MNIILNDRPRVFDGRTIRKLLEELSLPSNSDVYVNDNPIVNINQQLKEGDKVRIAEKSTRIED